MRTYTFLLPAIFICLVFVQCKKTGDSPTDHLYIYRTNGYLETRQYTRLELSGNDTPKKKHEAFSITTHDKAFTKHGFKININYPDGAEATTYFDAAGKSTSTVTMSVSESPSQLVWVPVSGQLSLYDHSRQPHPAFFSKGHVFFSNLTCVDTLHSSGLDTIIISGELRYY